MSAAKLPILNPNEFDLWKMRIEQYFFMTDYSLWERLARKNELKARGTLLMALPDKHQLKFNINKDAKTLMEAIKKKNKTDLEEQSLDDLFNSLKIYEADVKSSSSASTYTQNIAFVSSSNTDSTNEPVSAAASVSAVSAKILVFALSNVDTLSNDVIYSFFASQSISLQLDNDDLKQIDADDFEEIDLKWKMAMLIVRARRFLQRTGRNLRENRPTFMGIDMSKMECYNCHRKGQFTRECRCPKDTKRNVWAAMTGVFKQKRNIPTMPSWYSPLQALLILTISDESLPHSPIYNRYRSGDGYYVVPPPYTRTFMPPKPDLVFYNTPNVNEIAHTAFNVELSLTKPDIDLSHTHRPLAPIIEDWVSDSEDDSEAKISQNAPSFVQPTEQVKNPRPSVKTIETSIPTVNHKTAISKPKNKGNYMNRKACFVCKSLDYLIKDSGTFLPKVIAAEAPMVNAVKGNWGNSQHALKDKGVIDSGCSRHMTGNMSYLSDFEELNGRYVAFGGNPKGGKISGKEMCDKKNSVLFTDTECLVLSPEFKLPDKNQVLLRVPRENNMYNVNLKNIIPARDLTCLFAKATLDESNLWHRMLGHINFKTMNKLVKGNLVRGLPTKVFENDRICVACKKGKQHRASCKTKPVSFVNQPLQRTPSIDFMRPFGCHVTILNTLDPLGKFNGKVDEGFLVGYFVSSKVFRVFNSRTQIVQKTLHVNFLENKPNVVCSRPTWLFDIDTLTKTMNYQPVTAGNQSNPSAGVQEQFDANKAGDEIVKQYVLFPVWSSGSKNPQNTDADAAFDDKEPEFEGKKPEFEVHVSLSSSPQTRKHDDKTKREAKGKSPVESSTRYINLSVEFEDFSDNSINEVNAVDSPVPVVGHISTNNTNTFSVAGPSNADVSPTHGKSSWIDTSQYPMILICQNWKTLLILMIKKMLEELLQFKMQKVLVLVDLAHGKRAIEEGINYEEVFAPAVRIEAIRLFLAYASFMGFMVYQMDVKSAFLYGTIEEEVYVCQPPGFEDPDYPDKVYKVVKALYGLHQALRACLRGYLSSAFVMGFKVIAPVFATFVTWPLLGVARLVGQLSFRKWFSEGKDRLDIVYQKAERIAEILRKFGMTDGKSASTPIDTEKPLLKDPDGEDVDMHTYRSMIGSLMYLTLSRLDIMFTVALSSMKSLKRMLYVINILSAG
nr:hypothetical protein [Tanacetum cinerariifolium]GEW07986.1 hypothetical protein [Tanacetum cinerariifolium]